MRDHNPSLLPIIAAVDSRKLEGVKQSRKLRPTRGSDGERLGEVPMVLFRLGSFILNKPPHMLITIANIKAILVKVRLHTLNELLMNPFLDTNECFCAKRFLAMFLFTSRLVTSPFDSVTKTSLPMSS